MHETETHEPRPAGALEELAADPSSRKRFLKSAGGTGVASAFALFLAACGSKKTKLTPGGSNPNTGAGVGTDQYGPGDLGIARYLVTLEYIEADYYAFAVKAARFPVRTAGFVKRFAVEDAAHAAALEAAIGKLGGKPPLRPRVSTFPVRTATAILAVGLSVESLVASAYLGQLDRIQSKELLAVVLGIHSVEGRHAATLATLLGQPPAPDTFGQPAFAADVLNQFHSLTAQGS